MATACRVAGLVLFFCIFIDGGSPVLGAGQVRVQPFVSFEAKNNSNFWKSASEEVSVNTYHVAPGIALQYMAAKTEVVLDGGVDAYWYDDRDSAPEGGRAASDDDFIGATFMGQLAHQLTDRVKLGVTDRFHITRDPSRAENNSNSTSRNKYTINYLEPNVHYGFGEKLGLKIKYRNTYTDYSDSGEDSREHRGIFDLYYNLNRRAVAYLDYSVWGRTFDGDSSDYQSHFVSLNYEHKFNFFSIKGGGGYHNRSFDDEREDIDIFSWNLRILGKDPGSSEKTTRSLVSLRIGQEINDGGTENNYFTASYIRATGGLRFIERLGAYLAVEYQNSDYEVGERDEDTYLVSARLAYDVSDHVSLSIKAGVQSRDSNQESSDYDDVFVGASLDFRYDTGEK